MRRSHLLGLGLVGITLLALPGLAISRRRTHIAASAPASRPHSEGAESAGRAVPSSHARPRDLDVTFLMTSDTHVGYLGDVIGGQASSGRGVDEARDLEIRTMNEIAGKPLPSALGGRVAEPRGVLISGDLTEQGRPPEWTRFEAIFGLTGKEGQLRYPVYEGAGNHDKWGGSYVEEQITRRHGGARYSWSWQDLHIVCLGEAPSLADLAWLRGDLDAAGPDRGIILYLHFPLAGPNSTGEWFGDSERAKLAEVLAGREVLGIFNGHSHTSGRYQWHGYDAYLEGSVKHIWHSFAVVHVTRERMTVASFNYDRQAFWWWHDKPIFGAQGPSRQWFSEDAALVGAPKG